MNHNYEYNCFYEFYESFYWITEPEGDFGDHHTAQETLDIFETERRKEFHHIDK